MNDNLHKAKAAKNDEFYTQLSDIEKELSNYPADTFKNKIIYCPCDVGVDGLDVPKSNFVKYFEMNKERLGYKQLLHTSLQEGYDFHSDYCTRLLNEADIVVTNPPFSLFRDFFKWLMQSEKKFIIVGHKGAVCYNEVFPYIKDNKAWLGITSPKDFIQPNTDEPKSMTGLTRWFTNLDIPKRHEPLICTEKYSEDKYKKYDHIDAIEVGKVKDIPADYMGIMGVPITFINEYSPEQFELIDCTDGRYAIMDTLGVNEYIRKNHYRICSINDKPMYARLLMKRRTN